MDESVQESCRKRNDYRMLPHSPVSGFRTEMSQDSTIDFEKRRNIPVRYDRELVQTTVQAMKRIAEIKQRREHAFWKNRYVASFPFVSSSHVIPLL